MRLTVKLYAGLEYLLPDNAADNSTSIEVPENSSINSVIRQCNVPQGKAHLVLLNGIYVNSEHRDDINPFTDGDTLAIWPPVAGG